MSAVYICSTYCSSTALCMYITEQLQARCSGIRTHLQRITHIHTYKQPSHTHTRMHVWPALGICQHLYLFYLCCLIDHRWFHFAIPVSFFLSHRVMPCAFLCDVPTALTLGRPSKHISIFVTYTNIRVCRCRCACVMC